MEKLTEKERLLNQINKYKKLTEKNKNTRMIITIMVITIIFVVFGFLKIEIKSVQDISLIVIGAIFGAVIYFYINALIFTYLFTKSNEENNYLSSLKNRYDDLEE